MPFVTHADAGVDGGNGVAANGHDFIKNKLIPFMLSATHFPSAGDRWIRSKADVVVGTDEEEMFLTPPANAPDTPYMAFHTQPERLWLFAADGFDAATPSYDQPGGLRGAPYDTSAGSGPDWIDSDRHDCTWVNQMGSGPFLAHYLFAPSNGAYVHAVIQCAARKWRHIWFGAMNKFASFAGGAYSWGHYWEQSTGTVGAIHTPYSSRHACPANISAAPLGNRSSGGFRADGIRTGVTWFLAWNGSSTETVFGRPTGPTSNVHGTTVTLGAGQVTGIGNSFGTTLWKMSPSVLSAYQPLVPLIVFAAHVFEGASRWAPIGQIPDIARVSMKYFSPAQELTIGAETWRVFPLVNSDTINTVLNEEYSGYEGYAYRVRS